jgi:hypothetical protein
MQHAARRGVAPPHFSLPTFVPPVHLTTMGVGLGAMSLTREVQRSTPWLLFAGHATATKEHWCQGCRGLSVWTGRGIHPTPGGAA